MSSITHTSSCPKQKEVEEEEKDGKPTPQSNPNPVSSSLLVDGFVCARGWAGKCAWMRDAVFLIMGQDGEEKNRKGKDAGWIGCGGWRWIWICCYHRQTRQLGNKLRISNRPYATQTKQNAFPHPNDQHIPTSIESPAPSPNAYSTCETEEYPDITVARTIPSVPSCLTPDRSRWSASHFDSFWLYFSC